MGFIGVIDSGVGGLTILQQLLSNYPNNYVYIADHAFCPYGTKPNDVILNRSGKLVNYLKLQGAQAVVLACNTMSVYASAHQRQYGLPIYDVITPTCKRVVSNSAVKRAALLATKSTIANGAYQKYLAQYGVEAVCFDCSAFVPFIEQNSATSIACQRTVQIALSKLPQARADAVILGCTHFPLLRRQIAYYCDDNKIVQCCCNLPSNLSAANDFNPTVQYFTTGDVDFANLAASGFPNVQFTRISLS